MVKVTIDGQEADVPKGLTLVDAAKTIGIEIPIFCYHEKMKPVAACRMCLVEVEKMRGLIPACATYVAEGMVVRTNTPAVIEQQRNLLEFLLINHPLDCPVCDKGGECPLQDTTFKFGPGISRYVEPKRHFVKPIPLSEHILLDRERCIMCYRCVRFHSDIAQDNALGVIHRGADSEIGVAPGHVLDSPFQGNITELCPVGALTSARYRFTARPWDIQNVPTVCTQCSIGCNISFTIREGAVKRILSRRNDPVDDGWLCDRGRYSFEPLNSPERLSTPLLRKDGEFVAVSWREALTTVAQRLAAIREEHGADAIGGVLSPAHTNEEAYVFQKFFRSVLGTNNIDYRRPGQGDSDEILQDLFGYRAAMGSIQGLEDAKTIFLIGANPVLEQPVLDLRIRKAVGKGSVLITVNDERRRLDHVASHVLRTPLGREIALLHGLLKAVVDGGVAEGGQFAHLVAEARDVVRNVSLERVALEAGTTSEALGDVAERLRSGPTVFCYSESWADREQSREAVRLLALLAVATGNVGRTGAGLNRLPQAANTQGVIDAGVGPKLLPGHRALADAAARNTLMQLWGTEISQTPGLSTDGLLNASASGKLRALIACGVDPAGDWGDVARDSLSDIPFLVVIDTFLTETAQGADVVLPAATPAEQDGTLTNLERRIQRLRPAIESLGDALPGWQIICDLANRMGGRFYYGSAAEIMLELSQAVPVYAGVTYGRIGAKGIQWPVDNRAHPGTPFLYIPAPVSTASVSGN
ncbi:MAG: NADH-quinone oxidoreductase subunit NuoG [Chloroflexi bacterium]|nr:NADH-quinone oxidoreductase subunit NuoG [Chloroflexota bacterium]